MPSRATARTFAADVAGGPAPKFGAMCRCSCCETAVALMTGCVPIERIFVSVADADGEAVSGA